MKVKLQKALRHKGQELTELDIPLEVLTGADLIEVEQQLLKSGKITLITDFAKVYLIRVAARAAKIPVEVMENLSARDFTAITNRVQNFLMESDSETGKAEPGLETLGADPEISSEE